MDQEHVSEPADAYEAPQVDDLGPVEALTLVASA